MTHTPAEPEELEQQQYTDSSDVPESDDSVIPNNPVAPAREYQAGDGHEVVEDSQLEHAQFADSSIPAPAEPSDINVTKAKPQVTKALHKPCPRCDGTGLYGYVHGQHMPCPTCLGTGRIEPKNPPSQGKTGEAPSSIQENAAESGSALECSDTTSIPAEPGPPTSSESPQTLGVTAGYVPGTDEGGPGTIESASANSFQNGNSSAQGRGESQMICLRHQQMYSQGELCPYCPSPYRLVTTATSIAEAGKPTALSRMNTPDSQTRATGTGQTQ